MDGILIINKEKNMTSHDVVGKIRRLLHTKKVGHAGTLDPLATGVLVLGIGRATKLLQFLTADTKIYRAVLKLGVATTTYDREGEVTDTKPFNHDIDEKKVLSCFEKFLGDSMQVPPIYSALKKNGKPLYEYARNNEEVEIEARPIHISKLDLISIENDEITFEVCCSKGTYIRSLCVDIAKSLGYPGMMNDLVRVQSGAFKLEEACLLEDVEKGNFTMIGIDQALSEMESLIVEDENIVFHGKKIKSNINHQVAVYNSSGQLLAVYGPDGQGYLKSVRGVMVMKTIEIGLNHLPEIHQPLALATGYFDGFHIGHQSLVNEAKTIAQNKGYASAVLSFHPNPLVTLGKMKEEKYLSSLEDRKEILEKLGVDYFLILDFTKEVASMEPADFVQKFIIEMNVKAVICGFDFFFGNKGKGNGDFLKQYPNDFEVSIIEQVAMDHLKISSTRINQLLQEGKIEKANTLLTRPYHISGQVISGKQRGRLLGFPTANVDYGSYYLPGFGVYGVKVKIGQEEYIGMCNIGNNPTFKDVFCPSMEVNIFDFNEDIYGKTIDLYFYCFIREEKAFASKEDLIQQLTSDKQTIKTYFGH